MTMAAQGVAKLIEECGELQTVLGKKLAHWSSDSPHWDGTDLHERMVEEMGDVLAAIEFVASKFGMTDAVSSRALLKEEIYRKWESDTDNNTYGIDA